MEFTAYLYEDLDEQIIISVDVMETDNSYSGKCTIKSIPYSLNGEYSDKVYATKNAAIFGTIEAIKTHFSTIRDSYYNQLKKVLENCYNDVIDLRFTQQSLFDDGTERYKTKTVRVSEKIHQQRRKQDQSGLYEYDH